MKLMLLLFLVFNFALYSAKTDETDHPKPE